MQRFKNAAIVGGALLTLGAGLTACSTTCRVAGGEGEKEACCGGCAGDLEGPRAAHHAYTQAINSNDLEAILAMMTDDVVFLPPNGPRVIGKDAVRAWCVPYLQAYTVNWQKDELELMTVGNGWAFQQYGYVENDTAKDGSHSLQDTGKGVILWQRADDGRWLVARDIWCSDLPAE